MRKVLRFVLFLFFIPVEIFALELHGSVTDKVTHEPLTGASLQVIETMQGTVTDYNGNYNLTVPQGKYDLIIRYIGYQLLTISSTYFLDTIMQKDFELLSDDVLLADVNVIARKNQESEKILMLERKNASVAVENIGLKELTLKGVGNAEEGVTKLTGISVTGSGQIIVRGLGDRYSTTTLNGIPIASPNPDNKLIPLSLFAATTIQNISVNKVFDAAFFADYSGAHIDIGTRSQMNEDFLSVSVAVAGTHTTLLQDFYKADPSQSLLFTPKIDDNLLQTNDFDAYVKSADRFKTDFSVKRQLAIPDFALAISGGKTWKIRGRELGILMAAQAENEHQTLHHVPNIQLCSDGTVYSSFVNDSYTSALKTTALAGLNYTFRKHGRLSYTCFYARNAVDKYMLREGYNPEADHLVGSNSVFHAYQLLTNQLTGKHEFGNKWNADWKLSYSKTESEEPDRRQLMFQRQTDGRYEIYKLNAQETMRYFGSLTEREWVADAQSTYQFNKNGKLRFGSAFKNKTRDFSSVRFYYNLNNIAADDIADIYNPNNFLNQSTIADGIVTLKRDKKSFYSYDAALRIIAAFMDAEYRFRNKFLLSIGVRYEHSEQWVHYWNDQAREQLTQLYTDDFFPAINAKYDINESQSLRLAVSRTVTRPSFVEMAPFKYQESFGGTLIRGNADLQNGYNYNVDFRYDFIPDKGRDMLSATLYYKYLEHPIERIQRYAGTTPEHSFQNAENGMAAGIEAEIRKEIVANLRIGVNASYIYTNIILPEGGDYTDKQRSLQGASPYLLNADISYTPQWGENSKVDLSLIYNLQGPRIHSVGLDGLGNVVQHSVHTLDFVAKYQINKHLSMGLKAKNLLNSSIRFTQKVPVNGQQVIVEEYRSGIYCAIEVIYNL